MLHTHKEGGPSLSSFSRSLEVHGLQPEWDFGKKDIRVAIICSLSNIMAGSMKAFLVLLLISLDPRPFLSLFYNKVTERMGNEERVWEPNYNS